MGTVLTVDRVSSEHHDGNYTCAPSTVAQVSNLKVFPVPINNNNNNIMSARNRPFWKVFHVKSVKIIQRKVEPHRDSYFLHLADFSNFERTPENRLTYIPS
jgi:hypothetical protein